MLKRFFLRQLARPSGWFGRLFVARWLEKANTVMNGLTIERLVLNVDDRLLEVGFGSGYLLDRVLASRSCAFVAGVELSEEMVRLGRRRFRRFIEAGRADIRLGEIESLPFGDAEFTKLCSVNTLYFWRDPAFALAECRRVLKPGRRIALCFNAKADLTAFLGDAPGFTMYELPEVQGMLAQAGFHQIEVTPGQDPKQGLFYCVTGVVT